MSVILTASLAGVRGDAALGTYALTKAALIQLAVMWPCVGGRTTSVSRPSRRG